MTKPAVQDSQLATVQQEPSILAMVQGVIDKGVKSEDIIVLEQLMKLHERMQDKAAEKQFNSDFVVMQKEFPQITAQSVIPNRGKYEKFEDVMVVVSPILRRHGFAESFSQELDDKNRVTVTCHLMHIGGHSRDTKFTVRSGGKSDTETQADCKASTTAKRNALCQALDIIIRQDVLNEEDDAAMEGDFITPDQAVSIRRRVEKLKLSEAKFLRFAGAEKYDEIMTSKLSEIEEVLSGKEAKQSQQEDLSLEPEKTW